MSKIITISSGNNFITGNVITIYDSADFMSTFITVNIITGTIITDMHVILRQIICMSITFLFRFQQIFVTNVRYYLAKRFITFNINRFRCGFRILSGYRAYIMRS